MSTLKSMHEQFLEVPEHRRLYEQERLLVEVTELLTQVMEKKGMSRAQLAHKLGKSKAFVTQVLRGNHNMTLRTLADLFGAMEHQLFVQAVLRAEELSDIPDFDWQNQWGYYKYWSRHFDRLATAALPSSSLRRSAGRRSAARAGGIGTPLEEVAA